MSSTSRFAQRTDTHYNLGMVDLRGLIDEFIGGRRPPYEAESARGRRNMLRQFCRDSQCRVVADLTVEAMSDWVHDPEASPAYRRSRFSALRVFSTFLVTEGYMERNLGWEIAAPKVPRRVPRPLSHSDASKLMATARHLDAHPRSRAVGISNQVIVSLMCQEGLRAIEIRRLEVADLDFESATMRVVGKGSHERVLPLSGQTAALLRRHLRESHTGFGPVLSKRDSREPLSKSAMNHRTMNLFSRAGVKTAPYDGKSGHAMRATAATDVYEASGHDVRAVQEMLGHSSLATTEAYLRRASVQQLREAMAGREY